MNIERYHRQQILIGEEGQNSLNKASVLLIGLGGIGSPIALYLAASGIGHIGVVDNDVVELSNLHRQILYDMDDIGQLKTSQALKRLKKLNDQVDVITYPKRFDADLAHQLLPKYDLVIDGSDNFPTRYSVNDFCVLYKKPLISASVHQRQGQILFFNGYTGCYRCLFPLPPIVNQNCSTSGVLGMAVGMTATTAGMMAINYFLSPEDAPIHQMLVIDTQPISMKIFDFAPNTSCTMCADDHHLSDKLNQRYRPIGIEPDDAELDQFLCIDVRENNEDRSIVLSVNDLHIPLSELEANLDKLIEKPLLFYCAKGIRSYQTAFIMRDKGYDAYFYCAPLKTIDS